MTVTIKLDPAIEEQLRRRALSTGRSTSDVIRAALQAYLALPADRPLRSAAELGADLFGRHAGPADLAATRKPKIAEVWAERHARRGR